jgi:hypothetical protein
MLAVAQHHVVDVAHTETIDVHVVRIDPLGEVRGALGQFEHISVRQHETLGALIE